MPLDKQGKPVLYKAWVNKTKSRFKYFIYVKADTKKGYKKIGFGHKDYGQYKDKLGYYKDKDHGDKKRKDNYYSRHGKATSKDTAKYWSHKILW
tara:strand:+ start:222 stop:503 length:282 start_codon:yes stop_codon:yes gene_type:complete